MHVGYFKTIEEAIAARDAAVADLGALPFHDAAEIEKRAAEATKDSRMRVMWRRVLNQTGGVVKWKSYEEFARDIGDLPPANEKKMILVPIDSEKTIGPGNHQWKVQEAKYDYSTQEGKLAYAQAHREANRNSYRDKMLRATFGLSIAEYEVMAAKQGNVCACCDQPERTVRRGRKMWLAVDHCHATGKIRELLCNTCNQGLGQFKDDPALLRKAAEYLERHKSSDGAALVQPENEERSAHHGNHSPERP